VGSHFGHAIPSDFRELDILMEDVMISIPAAQRNAKSILTPKVEGCILCIKARSNEGGKYNTLHASLHYHRSFAHMVETEASMWGRNCGPVNLAFVALMMPMPDYGVIISK
jgi:hypothetical protein